MAQKHSPCRGRQTAYSPARLSALFIACLPTILPIAMPTAWPAAGPLLEALDALEEDGCEGNAFYTLQSCVNHSCAPNAHAFKRDEDTDGSGVGCERGRKKLKTLWIG